MLYKLPNRSTTNQNSGVFEFKNFDTVVGFRIGDDSRNRTATRDMEAFSIAGWISVKERTLSSDIKKLDVKAIFTFLWS